METPPWTFTVWNTIQGEFIVSLIESPAIPTIEVGAEEVLSDLLIHLKRPTKFEINVFGMRWQTSWWVFYDNLYIRRGISEGYFLHQSP